MKLTPVKSSNIHAVGYDNITHTLFIQFHSGQTYKYLGVSLKTYEEMLASDSIGSFYHRNIKKNFAGERKMEEETE